MKQAALFLSETHKLTRITPASGPVHIILLRFGQINLHNWKSPASLSPLYSAFYTDQSRMVDGSQISSAFKYSQDCS